MVWPSTSLSADEHGTAKGDAGWLQATRSSLTAGTAHRAGGRPRPAPNPLGKNPLGYSLTSPNWAGIRGGRQALILLISKFRGIL